MRRDDGYRNRSSRHRRKDNWRTVVPCQPPCEIQVGGPPGYSRGYLGIAFWGTLSFLLNTAYLPSPYIVAVTLYDLFRGHDPVSGMTMTDLMSLTLAHYFPAFIFIFLLALPLGIFIGISEVASNISRPFVEVLSKEGHHSPISDRYRISMKMGKCSRRGLLQQ